MTPHQRREIAKKLRELAELIDYPLEQEFPPAPSLQGPSLICNCPKGVQNIPPFGWFCPVHGSYFR